MTMEKLELFLDYVCPFCYIGTAMLEDVWNSKSGIQIEVKPYELAPRGTPTGSIQGHAEKLQRWQELVCPMAKKEGLAIELPKDPVPYTDLAFEGMYFVREHGGPEWAYHKKMFEAVFVRSLDIGDLDQLCAVVSEIDGIDTGAFRQALLEGIYNEREAQARRYAYEKAEIEYVPTLRYQGKEINGVLDKEELRAYVNGLS